MTKYEVLAIIKEANVIVDEMASCAVGSEEYTALNQSLGWTLDCLLDQRGFVLRLSKRTGHYYVTF